jgi:hypothetical protein
MRKIDPIPCDAPPLTKTCRQHAVVQDILCNILAFVHCLQHLQAGTFTGCNIDSLRYPQFAIAQRTTVAACSVVCLLSRTRFRSSSPVRQAYSGKCFSVEDRLLPLFIASRLLGLACRLTCLLHCSTSFIVELEIPSHGSFEVCLGMAAESCA